MTELNQDAGAAVDTAPETETPAPVEHAPSAEASVQKALDQIFSEGDDPGEVNETLGLIGDPEAQEPPAEQPEQSNQNLPDGYYLDGAGRLRGPDGKYATLPEDPAPQDVVPEGDDPAPAESAQIAAPSRFTPAAKALFEKADPALQQEVLRLEGELTNGLQQYQQAFAPLQRYFDMAQQAGTTVPEAMERYIRADQLLAQDPVAGVANILSGHGIDLHAFAEHVLSLQPGQINQGPSQETLALQNQVQQLTSQLQQVQGSFQNQARQRVSADVDAFAADNPRFDELGDSIAQLLEAGMAHSLTEAYTMAERLKPAPETASVPSPDVAAQTRKAQASVNGAPGAGSNLAKQTASTSAESAVDRAFEKLGF